MSSQQKQGPANIGDAFLGKVPPHSNDAELSVIGSCLLHNDVIDDVLAEVKPTDFYSETHEILFTAIRDMHDDNRPVDLISLGEHLKERGDLENVGGLAYLASIQDNVPTAAHVVAHATIIREKSLVRAILGVGLDILQKGYGDYGDVREFANDVAKAVDEAIQHRVQNPIQHVYESLKKTFSNIERQRETKSVLTGVDTGFEAINAMTNGLQLADLIIVAGRPSMGKTALALNMATNAVKRAGTGVVIFSLEMSADQLNRRLLSSEAGVFGHKLRDPKRLEDEDFGRIIEAADRFHKAPIYIDDSPEPNVLDIRARSRSLKRKVDIGLIIVDYLQIMPELDPKASRERQIAENTRRLKALAKDLNVPVVVLSQLNRGPENRQDKRPELRDLRESGAIEQDADLIMFLYREGAYNPTSADNTAEVIFGKQRNGPIGTVKLVFQKEYTRFVDFSDEYAIYEPEPEPQYPTMLGSEQRELDRHPAEPPEKDDDGAMPF